MRLVRGCDVGALADRIVVATSTLFTLALDLFVTLALDLARLGVALLLLAKPL